MHGDVRTVRLMPTYRLTCDLWTDGGALACMNTIHDKILDLVKPTGPQTFMQASRLSHGNFLPHSNLKLSFNSRASVSMEALSHVMVFAAGSCFMSPLGYQTNLMVARLHTRAGCFCREADTRELTELIGLQTGPRYPEPRSWKMVAIRLATSPSTEASSRPWPARQFAIAVQHEISRAPKVLHMVVCVGVVSLFVDIFKL